ncbi:hypothetical protein EDB83DRAFT_668065 [Lactarius deliciosus]|nr:hypothetical protein EDB83DRAFT_668065 [Lactarius deliciosus]
MTMDLYYARQKISVWFSKSHSESSHQRRRPRPAAACRGLVLSWYVRWGCTYILTSIQLSSLLYTDTMAPGTHLSWFNAKLGGRRCALAAWPSPSHDALRHSIPRCPIKYSLSSSGAITANRPKSNLRTLVVITSNCYESILTRPCRNPSKL